MDEALKSEDFIEFRKKTDHPSVTDKTDDLTEAIDKVVSAIVAKGSSLIIVDDQESFVFFSDRIDNSKSVGLALKVPGFPMMQRILFERAVQQGTTKLK
jgi:hypothetical protein